MTDMDLQPQDDGHLHLRIGPVEKWVAGIVALVVVSLVAWVFNSVTSAQNEQGKTLTEIKTQQAVTNDRLQNLGTALSNIPQISSDVATLKVQVDRNTSDIHELQQVRKLQ